MKNPPYPCDRADFLEKLNWPLFILGRNPAHTTEHFKAQPRSVLLDALPEMPITGSLEDVSKFIRSVKDGDYFMEAAS